MTDEYGPQAEITRLRERVARLEERANAADKALELKERNIVAQARAHAAWVAMVVAAIISIAVALLTSGALKAH